MNTRYEKGEFEYLSWQRKRAALRSLLYFAIIMAVFFAGLLTTKTRNNMLTVVAVVGVLPLGKSLVNLIMLFRSKPATEALREGLAPYGERFHVMYNMLLSSPERVYPLDVIVVRDHSVYAYVSKTKTPLDQLEKYLKNLLSNHGKGNVNVKVYSQESELLKRLEKMDEMEHKTELEAFENKIVEIIGSMCL